MQISSRDSASDEIPLTRLHRVPLVVRLRNRADTSRRRACCTAASAWPDVFTRTIRPGEKSGRRGEDIPKSIGGHHCGGRRRARDPRRRGVRVEAEEQHAGAVSQTRAARDREELGLRRGRDCRGHTQRHGEDPAAAGDRHSDRARAESPAGPEPAALGLLPDAADEKHGAPRLDELPRLAAGGRAGRHRPAILRRDDPRHFPRRVSERPVLLRRRAAGVHQVPRIR